MQTFIVILEKYVRIVLQVHIICIDTLQKICSDFRVIFKKNLSVRIICI